MSATWATFLFEIANFLLLAAVLGWLFFRPVRDALERRRAEYEAERSAARESRAEAERALAEVRAKRAEFESSLEALRDRVGRDAEAERQRLLETARTEAERERVARREELVSERRAQARLLAEDAGFAAREIITRLLELLQGPDLDRGLRDAACRELEALRRTGSLASVVVESARPLADADLAVLAQSAGLQSTDLHPRVDPDLVAGFRVISSRGLIDASVRGLADQAVALLLRRLEQEDSDDGEG